MCWLVWAKLDSKDALSYSCQLLKSDKRMMELMYFWVRLMKPSSISNLVQQVASLKITWYLLRLKLPKVMSHIESHLIKLLREGLDFSTLQSPTHQNCSHEDFDYSFKSIHLPIKSSCLNSLRNLTIWIGPGNPYSRRHS